MGWKEKTGRQENTKGKREVRVNREEQGKQETWKEECEGDRAKMA